MNSRFAPPELKDYKPSGNGESPLAKVQEWVEIIDPKTGKKALPRDQHHAAMGRLLLVLLKILRPAQR